MCTTQLCSPNGNATIWCEEDIKHSVLRPWATVLAVSGPASAEFCLPLLGSWPRHTGVLLVSLAGRSPLLSRTSCSPCKAAAKGRQRSHAVRLVGAGFRTRTWPTLLAIVQSGLLDCGNSAATVTHHGLTGSGTVGHTGSGGNGAQ